MKIPALILFLLVAVPAFADSMVTLSVNSASKAVTATPQWAVPAGIGGFHHMAQDLSLGGGPNQFHSIRGGAIPVGGDVAAFNLFISSSGAATAHADIGSKLTPNSYLGLTSADPDVGFGAVNFYLIHRRDTGDYFSVIVPGSGVASAVTDLKPMNGPGGPGTLSAPGYFALTFSAGDLGYGANLFYYLRADGASTKFGTLEPALLGTSTDKFTLGPGYQSVVFAGTDVGFGASKMYFTRLDPVTGFSIFGTLDPLTGKSSDIANLGSVYPTLTFVPGDLGYGSGKFYVTGLVNPNHQQVSFAAIQDRDISLGSFTTSPSASSGLGVTLSVVEGPGTASISGPVGGVFTVTPLTPGSITLQASQAGDGSFEPVMLRQSFTITGVPDPVIAGLMNQVTTLTGQVTTLTASNSSLTGQVATLAGQNSSLVTQVSTLGSTNTTLTSSLSGANSQVSSLQVQNASLQHQASSASALAASLASKVSGLNSQVSTLTAARVSLEAQVSDLKSNEGSLTSRIATLTEANKAIGDQLVALSALNGQLVVKAGSRISNLSTRALAGAGSQTLVSGLVVSGSPRRVLVRGVGPALEDFGVQGVLLDPKISIYSGQEEIGSNDNWAGDQDGAFPLPEGSLDASLELTLAPGAYTIHLSGVNNTSGVALIEVYDITP